MYDVNKFFLLLLSIQFFHSIEELATGFHEKFPLVKMKFRTFLFLEACFFGFWMVVLLLSRMPYREQLMAFFNILMFANGFWHLVWWGIVKKYVPGLVTAPFFVIIFLVFYFRVLF